jgi:hypothetical protein
VARVYAFAKGEHLDAKHAEAAAAKQAGPTEVDPYADFIGGVVATPQPVVTANRYASTRRGRSNR